MDVTYYNVWSLNWLVKLNYGNAMQNGCCPINGDCQYENEYCVHENKSARKIVHNVKNTSLYT